MTYPIWEGDLDFFMNQELNERISEALANNSNPQNSDRDIRRAEALKFRKEIWDNNHHKYSRHHVNMMKKGLFGGPFTYEMFARE